KRKAGWDTHGLPVELGVEKELGITKEDIGTKITIEEYNEACKKAVMKYTDIWNNLTAKMGYWVDMDDPYITYEPKYMETVWWLLKQIYNKGLIYKGYTIQPYSPKAGTGLSTHELNQPGTYQDVTDTTVVAQFKLLDGTQKQALFGSDSIYLLAWTTTPWTLPSNTALTVGKKINYACIQTFNQYTFEPIKVVLADNLVSKQFAGKYKEVIEPEDLEAYKSNDKTIPFYRVSSFTGADLLEMRYEQLMPFAQPFEGQENAYRIIAGDFVTTEDGTGIVHTAPTFGADDAKVAKEANPPVPPMLVLNDTGIPVPLVDLQGKFIMRMGDYAGKYVKNEYYADGEAPDKSVDVEIAIQLKIENKAFKVEKYLHSYPNCWRTDKPILYYPLDSWFIEVTKVRDKMYAYNQTINWKPKSTGEGRFGNWLKNANDWNLSRSRFWGIPLPIWRNEEGSTVKVIGSVEELMTEIAVSISAGNMTSNPYEGFEAGNMDASNYAKIDLHKNIVDGIILTDDAGKPMKRESDLIDVWFDSGSMPYAQWHYPFENKAMIDEGKAFPADYIAEGVDQTRGWFYTLHAIGTMVFDSIAYKNVISNGLVLDKNGNKMSKRLGNTVDPFITINKYGADVVRWYMLTNASPWDNLKFNEEGIEETKRKFFGTLQNVYSFFSIYANVDGFEIHSEVLDNSKMQELDFWIISKLHSLIQEVEEAMNDYEPTRATRAIQEFTVEHLSNWYIRLSRRRFWKSDDLSDKMIAYQVLHQCIENVSILMSSFSPFYADALYKDITKGAKKESVHLASFPAVDPTNINVDLERKMRLAQQATTMILAIRKKEKIKVRQPLGRILIPVTSSQMQEDLMAVEDVILREVNIKQIEYLNKDSETQIVKSAKPDFKKLGPKAGAKMKLVMAACSNLSQEQITTLELDENLSLTLADGSFFEVTLDEMNITSTDMPGWIVESEGGLTVALDLTISENLALEGYAREFINKVQNWRKINELEVTDRIEVTVEIEGQIKQAIDKHIDYIRGEILAEALVFDEVEDGEIIDLNNNPVKIFVRRI
ncbi:MAG: isoleucyl-tRNA synthetase, partial [Bacteroidia bacterium]